MPSWPRPPFGRDEDQAGRAALLGRLHRHRRRDQLGARDELLHRALALAEGLLLADLRRPRPAARSLIEKSPSSASAMSRSVRTVTRSPSVNGALGMKLAPLPSECSSQAPVVAAAARAGHLDLAELAGAAAPRKLICDSGEALRTPARRIHGDRVGVRRRRGRRIAPPGGRGRALRDGAGSRHDRAHGGRPRRGQGGRLVPGPHGVRAARARRPLDPGRSALALDAEDPQPARQVPRVPSACSRPRCCARRSPTGSSSTRTRPTCCWWPTSARAPPRHDPRGAGAVRHRQAQRRRAPRSRP